MVVNVRSRDADASRMPTWPPHALPTQSTGSVRPKLSKGCSVATTSSSKVKSRRHRIALAVRRAVDSVNRALPGQFVDQRPPGLGVHEQAVPQHNRRPGARAPDVQPAEVGGDQFAGVHDPSIYFGNRNFGNRSILIGHGHVKRPAR